MKENILELRANGKSYNEISKILNCSKSTISYYCKNFTDNDKLIIKNNKKRIGKKEYSNINEINKKTIIDLHDDGVKIVKISKTLNLSRYTITKYLKSIGKISSDNRTIVEKDLMRKEKNKYNTKIWRRKLKQECVEYKGGKCVKCDYDKYIDCLEFHHLDPNKKEFDISNKGWCLDKLKIELDKCILVCNRCHKEIHADIRLEQQ